MPKRCKGFAGKGCGSTRWEKVGVINSQKGTTMHQCQRCGRCIIIKGDHVPETENPLDTI